MATELPNSYSSATASQFFAQAAASCDDLPSGLDVAVFDFGVNSGAVRMLQQELKARQLHAGAIDGLFGSKSLNALRQVNGIDGLVEAYQDRRLAFLTRLKGWSTSGRGWQRRVGEVREFALRLAAGATVLPAQAALPTEVSDCRTPYDVGGACDVKATSVITSTVEGKAGAGVDLGTSVLRLSSAISAATPSAISSRRTRSPSFVTASTSRSIACRRAWIPPPPPVGRPLCRRPSGRRGPRRAARRRAMVDRAKPAKSKNIVY